MAQTDLFSQALTDAASHATPVNVASVPQRSPFRYPGGKTWFVPTFRLWMRSLGFKPSVLVEPFAGGGITSLTGVFEGLVSQAVLIEKDEEVAAVWQCILGGDAEWLAKRIQEFDLTEHSVSEILSAQPANVRENAFRTILKNRTFHGGILAPGSSVLKHGENGKGIKSRWYPETLAKRILHIALHANRLRIFCEDGITHIERYVSDPTAAFFIDPPYTAGGKKAGRRLYTHHTIDHDALFEVCQRIQGDFIMTYDYADAVMDLARSRSFDMRLIPMKNTHHEQMYELVIGKNLDWLNSLPVVHEPAWKYRKK